MSLVASSSFHVTKMTELLVKEVLVRRNLQILIAIKILGLMNEINLLFTYLLVERV